MEKKMQNCSDMEGFTSNEGFGMANPANINDIRLITIDWSTTEIFNSGWTTMSYNDL